VFGSVGAAKFGQKSVDVFGNRGQSILLPIYIIAAAGNRFAT
jgi:hypothetical protein